MTTKVFLMFKCVHIGDADYLAADLSVCCYDSAEHRMHTGLAIVAIFVYVIGVRTCTPPNHTLFARARALTVSVCVCV